VISVLYKYVDSKMITLSTLATSVLIGASTKVRREKAQVRDDQSPQANDASEWLAQVNDAREGCLWRAQVNDARESSSTYDARESYGLAIISTLLQKIGVFCRLHSFL